MAKVWIPMLLMLVAAAYAAVPEYDSNEAQDFYDTWYDDIVNLDDNVNGVSKDGSKELLDSYEYKEPIDSIISKYFDDYQIEDNRSDLIQENNENANSKESNQALKSSFEEEAPLQLNDQETIIVENDENAPNVEQPNSKENTDQISNLSDNDEEPEQSQEISFDVNRDLESLPIPPKGDIDEELKRVMSEADDKLIEDENIVVEGNKQSNNENDEEVSEQDFDDILDEDTVDQAYKDLNEDLAKLMETWAKLSRDDVEEEKDADDSVRPDDIMEYEEKYGRPYKEGVVLSQRDDLYEGDENDSDGNNEEDSPSKNGLNENDKKLDSKAAEMEDVILGKEENDVDDMVSAQDDVSIDEESDSGIEDDEDIENDPDDDMEDELDDIKEDEIDGDDSEEKPDNINDDLIVRKVIIDKAVSDEKNDDSKNVIKNADDLISDHDQDQGLGVNSERNIASMPMPYSIEKTEAKTVITTDVSEISPEQYGQVMEQFKMLHKEELDVNSDTIESNGGPIHVRISLDYPVVVLSPNFPNPYPTNDTLDWLFEGDGVGIEFNLTELAINGVAGDYLLVKPGGVDASGTDGLVFSYHLNEPRRYRFLDVDRLFVRFVAQPGWSFPSLRGFQFCVKMVAPLPLMEEEPLPEPEPELPEPVETLRLVLGGIPAAQFRTIQEEFRVLLADMATMYINANRIDPGLNTTLETTQLTSVMVCNINWPDFENCADVTFAVPLVYDDEDENQGPRLNSTELDSMWRRYSGEDPFAARLKRLGITEFASPNDSSVLAVWLVISSGVLVIMVIMAFALWRYSCFESYTRMPEYSSRDSLYNEKQGLDLYPTPHQTLPPLYESEYNWADGKFDDSTRVDMSGYTNKNFTRDELSDIESDEDVISTRDRKIVIAPRDGYDA